jgi:acyl-CoA thioester hydrolase
VTPVTEPPTLAAGVDALPGSPRFELEIPLRSRDIDTLGHLNQAVYHEILEEGRLRLFLHLSTVGGPAAGAPLGDGLGAFVLARVELDYRHEVRLDHRAVRLTLWIQGVGRSSIDVGHDVCLLDGTVAASGRSVLVAWDPATRRSRPLLAGERESLGVPVDTPQG